MKIQFLLFLLFCLSLQAKAQKVPNPVRWSFKANKVSAEEYQLVFTASIQKGWYLYSQYLNPGGPIPTSINFRRSESYELVGTTDENGSKKSQGYDDIFGMELLKYSSRVRFTQNVRIQEDLEEISGYIEFMTCDNESCLPPKEIDFAFSFQK